MSIDKGALGVIPWVIVTPEGLAYVGLHTDESDVWKVFLGWPSAEEIAEKKAKGWYAAPGQVSWQRPH